MQPYPEIVLAQSLLFPIQMNEAFECKEVCSARTRGQSLGKRLSLEGAGVSSGQQNQSTRAHLCVPVSLLRTEVSQLSKPSWFAGKFSLLPLVFMGPVFSCTFGEEAPQNQRFAVWGPAVLEEVRACATTSGGFRMRIPQTFSQEVVRGRN